MPTFKKSDNFRIIQEEISRLALEKRKTPVIIIDEANYISNAVLNDLKILFNFEMDSRDRAVILLVGLPQLNHTLQLAIHEPLRQRIIMKSLLNKCVFIDCLHNSIGIYKVYILTVANDKRTVT